MEIIIAIELGIIALYYLGKIIKSVAQAYHDAAFWSMFHDD